MNTQLLQTPRAKTANVYHLQACFETNYNNKYIQLKSLKHKQIPLVNFLISLRKEKC